MAGPKGDKPTGFARPIEGLENCVSGVGFLRRVRRLRPISRDIDAAKKELLTNIV
jgi:hypothetical protein